MKASELIKAALGKPKEEKYDKPEITKSFKIEIVKEVDEAKRLVMGIVLKPGEPDAHGDIMTPDDIEWTAHMFLLNYRYVGEGHVQFAEAGVVESYLAPQNMTINGREVTKGSWIVTMKILSDELWMKIKTGLYTAFSAGGFGYRQTIASDDNA